MDTASKKGISRGQFLRGGALAGAGLLLPWESLLSAAGKVKRKSGPGAPTPAGYSGTYPASVQDLGGSNLFYTAPLISKIPVAKPNSWSGLIANYVIGMREGTFKFHPSFPNASKTWGYDDGKGGYIGYLGPTLEVVPYIPIRVKWVNQLPGDPAGPLGWADPNLIMPSDRSTGGRAVVHVHGGHNPEAVDGGPMDWFKPNDYRIYQYDNRQDEMSAWYHDHAMGVTRLNVYAGLAGLYIIRGLMDLILPFPDGDYEVPLILQDKAFYFNGGNVELWYYKPWNMEFFGNVMMVNAQPWPVFHVEPRRYRFRIYNATQARFFNLRLTTDKPGVSATFGKTSQLPFYQIGAEGGFLPRMAQIDALFMGNAERADVIVDFTNFKGQEIYLSNDASTPYDPTTMMDVGDKAGTWANTLFPNDPTINTMQVMKFVVDKPLVRSDRSVVPSNGKLINPLFMSLNPNKGVSKYRQITLAEVPYGPGDAVGMPGNLVTVNNRPFMGTGSAITETPKLGTTEIWQFINLTPDWHPMHMHLVTFQVVGRQQLAPNPAYDPNTQPEKYKYLYTTVKDGSQISPTGDLRQSPYSQYLIPNTFTGPEANETGYKDTVKCPNGYVTFVVAKFTDYIGKFVYHCHILDHEENDMMNYMSTQPYFGKDASDQGSDSQATSESLTPTEFALNQNYPNPFNPSTQINFRLPSDGHALLRVFNAGGQEVARLVDANLSAGLHSATWNAQGLGSGAYFYRLESGSFSMVKKMLLLK